MPDQLDTLVDLAAATTDAGRSLQRCKQKLDKLCDALARHGHKEGAQQFQLVREMQTQLEEMSKAVRRMIPH